MSLSDYNRSHGIYDMKVFGGMLRIRAAGGWNEPTARRFNEEYRKSVGSLGIPWGVYFDLRQWGLAVPDAMPMLNSLGSWNAPQGKGAHMFLFNGMNIQESTIAGVLKVASHDSYFFTTAHEAEEWLRQRDYCVGDIREIVAPIILG